MLFIQLTHHYTNSTVYIKPSHITSLRAKNGLTLVMTGERGQYVSEPVELVMDLMEAFEKATRNESLNKESNTFIEEFKLNRNDIESYNKEFVSNFMGG